MRQKTPTMIGLVFLALSCAVLVGADDHPGDPPPPTDRGFDETAVARGAALYLLHCSSCHGKEGHGDGPLAKSLKSDVPDLTRISRRNDDRFPATEVERVIDGRTEVAAHGRREMPVWGLSFYQNGRLADQEEEIWLQIRDLVAHLESIQIPAKSSTRRRD